MSRVSKLLSFAVLGASLTVVPRAVASASDSGGSSAQSEAQTRSDAHTPDGRWALMLVGLFAVWAIATYASWDENAEATVANEYDSAAELPLLAVNHGAQGSEWGVAEQKLARIPPGTEKRAGKGGKSRVA
jgi:hypothetical protein